METEKATSKMSEQFSYQRLKSTKFCL